MDSLANHSMRIQGVYVGTVPIPQFIKKKSRGLSEAAEDRRGRARCRTVLLRRVA